MRLTANKLPAHLQRHGFAPLYLLAGEEPMQVLEAADLLRIRAREEGAERTVLVADKQFDWNRVLTEGANLSLFGGRKLIELRLGAGSPGKEGGDVLIRYAGDPPPDTILLVSMDKLDKRMQQSRWFKAVDKAGTVIQIWPVEPSRLPEWIIGRMRESGRRIAPEAAELIAQRTEGNLLASRQELDKLCLLVDKPGIGLEDAQEAVIDSARFDVFAMIQSALAGNAPRVSRMLRGLRQEGAEPITLYGAIMWELRRLCAMAAALADGESEDRVFAAHHVWPQRQAAARSVLRRHDARRLNAMLKQSALIDKALKGAARRDPWNLMEDLLFSMAGIRADTGEPG